MVLNVGVDETSSPVRGLPDDGAHDTGSGLRSSGRNGTCPAAAQALPHTRVLT